jgi:hypothetical protein
LKIVLSVDGESPGVELELEIDRMDELVAYAFLVAGWEAVGRVWSAVVDGVEARSSGRDVRTRRVSSAMPETRLARRGAGLAHEVQACRASIEKLNVSTRPVLVSLAARAGAVLQRRLDDVVSEIGRYVLVPERLSPRPGGQEGGPGGSGSGAAGGGTNVPSVAEAVRAAGGRDGDQVRELVRLVAKIGKRIQAHDQARQKREKLEQAAAVEKEITGKI